MKESCPEQKRRTSQVILPPWDEISWKIKTRTMRCESAGTSDIVSNCTILFDLPYKNFNMDTTNPLSWKETPFAKASISRIQVKFRCKVLVFAISAQRPSWKDQKKGPNLKEEDYSDLFPKFLGEKTPHKPSKYQESRATSKQELERSKRNWINSTCHHGTQLQPSWGPWLHKRNGETVRCLRFSSRWTKAG